MDEKRELTDHIIKGGYKGPVDNPHEAEDLEALQSDSLVPPGFERQPLIMQILYFATVGGIMWVVYQLATWASKLVLWVLRLPG